MADVIATVEDYRLRYPGDAGVSDARAAGIIGGVRTGLGDDYAGALEARYLESLRTSNTPTPRRAVGGRLGVSSTTVQHGVAVALKWIDATGPARVRESARRGAA